MYGVRFGKTPLAFSSTLQGGVRRHRLEAQAIEISIRAILRLAEDEEPG
jgi:hypothetical protein